MKCLATAWSPSLSSSGQAGLGLYRGDRRYRTSRRVLTATSPPAAYLGRCTPRPCRPPMSQGSHSDEPNRVPEARDRGWLNDSISLVSLGSTRRRLLYPRISNQRPVVNHDFVLLGSPANSTSIAAESSTRSRENLTRCPRRQGYHQRR